MPDAALPDSSPGRASLSLAADTASDADSEPVPGPVRAAAVVAVAVTVAEDSGGAPVMTATAAEAGVSAVDSGLPDWLGGDGSGTGLMTPLVWAAVAVSRRESTGGTTVPPAAVTAAVSPADPVGAFVRIFIGDGTADNPNAGILYGNGYSYTGYEGVCTEGACDGGNGGLIGNGGNGFNGGNGGSGEPGARSAVSAVTAGPVATPDC